MTRKPLKVLFVIHDARRGGVQSVMLRVISALDRRRVEPTVLFPFDGPCAAELRRLGVHVVAAGEQSPFIWRFKRFTMIPRLLKLAGQADIVHLNSTKLALPAIAASMAGVRTIYHLHELPGRIGPILSSAIGRADCAAFCSNTCAGHFAAVAARKRAVLVNAVPMPSVAARPKPGVPKIVMLGSINRAKGQDLLLDAFPLVRSTAELHFYGNVGLSARRYARALKERAIDKGIGDRVFFHSPTDDVPGVLAETTLLVHTSRQESFGMVLVEAMAAGIPVIANDLGGMREVVADGVSGYLLAPGDIALLAEKIDFLLADPELRGRMGMAGRDRVREKFDIATRIEDYHKLYEELASGGA
ncbi:glycosyltransferase family 4 protein [Geobacter sp. OR-1]|uniref:glycosyltransferase family 4 protein n=1 Tax=Geobacter sp. OR-1 TaxID=1266765 RepID=UPI0005A9439E|nr:glycosyltransferase family 4 protein [Geobacter sp. OR-1]